jgi:hypothetical protein
MEEENAFAKPNFPPLIMYVCTHRVHSIAYIVPLLQRIVSHFCGLEKPSYLLYIYGAYHLAENASTHLSP